MGKELLGRSKIADQVGESMTPLRIAQALIALPFALAGGLLLAIAGVLLSLAYSISGMRIVK